MGGDTRTLIVRRQEGCNKGCNNAELAEPDSVSMEKRGSTTHSAAAEVAIPCASVWPHLTILVTPQHPYVEPLISEQIFALWLIAVPEDTICPRYSGQQEALM